jgi:hypothetical protein
VFSISDTSGPIHGTILNLIHDHGLDIDLIEAPFGADAGGDAEKKACNRSLLIIFPVSMYLCAMK